jgi:Zn-finger nucleic acid-binding protein
MHCPVCKKNEMVILELDQVEIDYCFDCEGIWLDEGELELLLDDAQAKDAILNTLQEAPKTKEKPRKCPICSKKMQKVLYDNVMVDKCKKNHGLWFDKGELHQIIESAGEDKIISFLKNLGIA